MIDINMNSILNILNEKDGLTLSRKNINSIPQVKKEQMRKKPNDGILQYQKLKRAYYEYSRRI